MEGGCPLVGQRGKGQHRDAVLILSFHCATLSLLNTAAMGKVRPLFSETYSGTPGGHSHSGVCTPCCPCLLNVLEQGAAYLNVPIKLVSIATLAAAPICHLEVRHEEFMPTAQMAKIWCLDQHAGVVHTVQIAWGRSDCREAAFAGFVLANTNVCALGHVMQAVPSVWAACPSAPAPTPSP